jgi:hypothetical protein
MFRADPGAPVAPGINGRPRVSAARRKLLTDRLRRRPRATSPDAAGRTTGPDGRRPCSTAAYEPTPSPNERMEGRKCDGLYVIKQYERARAVPDRSRSRKASRGPGVIFVHPVGRPQCAACRCGSSRCRSKIAGDHHPRQCERRRVRGQRTTGSWTRSARVVAFENVSAAISQIAPPTLRAVRRVATIARRGTLSVDRQDQRQPSARSLTSRPRDWGVQGRGRRASKDIQRARSMQRAMARQDRGRAVRSARRSSPLKASRFAAGELGRGALRRHDGSTRSAAPSAAQPPGPWSRSASTRTPTILFPALANEHVRGRWRLPAPAGSSELQPPRDATPPARRPPCGPEPQLASAHNDEHQQGMRLMAWARSDCGHRRFRGSMPGASPSRSPWTRTTCGLLPVAD